MNSALALEKCLHQLLIKPCDCEVVSSQPLPKIPKELQFLPHCAICVASLYQGCCEPAKLTLASQPIRRRLCRIQCVGKLQNIEHSAGGGFLAGTSTADSPAEQENHQATFGIIGTRALRSSQRARPASKPSCPLRDTSARRCWNTTRTSAWQGSARLWTPSQSPFLTRVWHKIGHSRRQSKKLPPLTD